MALSSLMLEGVRLMALGMGIVFGFLILLVFVMKAMSRLARSMATETDIASTAPTVSSAPQGSEQQQLTAVIAAAIHRYRSDRTTRR